MRYLVPLTAVLVLLVLSLFGLFSAITDHQSRIDSFQRHCLEAGGHVYHPGIYFCLTSDGRMLEVFP